MSALTAPLIPEASVLVANGKQALALIAQELRSRGVRSLLAPDFYCLTMIEPFQLEGIGVRHVPTDERALMDPLALTAALSSVGNAAVLHCEVFGARASALLQAALESIRLTGVPIVVDATHSVFSTKHESADFLVASLRKLLPVPDGAFVTGIAHRTLRQRTESDETATNLALSAAEHRRAFLAGQALPASYLQRLDAAEDAMLTCRQPVAMSQIALRMLGELDVTRLQADRRTNAQFLIDRMTAAGLAVLNATTPECGVVVRVDDEVAVERALLDHGVVCPISWPRPPGLSRQIRWRTGWVTLPVDPCLEHDHLERVASVVTRARPRVRQ